MGPSASRSSARNKKKGAERKKPFTYTESLFALPVYAFCEAPCLKNSFPSDDIPIQSLRTPGRTLNNARETLELCKK